MAEIESYVNFERSLLPLALMDELISQNRARDYQKNEPFAHTVIDNFFDPSIECYPSFQARETSTG